MKKLKSINTIEIYNGKISLNIFRLKAYLIFCLFVKHATLVLRRYGCWYRCNRVSIFVKIFTNTESCHYSQQDQYFVRLQYSPFSEWYVLWFPDTTYFICFKRRCFAIWESTSSYGPFCFGMWQKTFNWTFWDINNFSFSHFIWTNNFHCISSFYITVIARLYHDLNMYEMQQQLHNRM